ncbi:MAG: hypothetical protein OK454_12150 [Thaumarchaeota archaeon]|nr:hypothetical protein [Nitrososphaerota archaeon]
MSDAEKYPEHEKLKGVQEESQAIGEFLDLGPYTLCEHYTIHWIPVRKSIPEILADYFEIDLKKIEAEKRAMLDEMRAANA